MAETINISKAIKMLEKTLKHDFVDPVKLSSMNMKQIMNTSHVSHTRNFSCITKDEFIKKCSTKKYKTCRELLPKSDDFRDICNK